MVSDIVLECHDWAAAYKADVGKILPENLCPGQVIEGMRIENPLI